MTRFKKYKKDKKIPPGYYKKWGEVCVLVCCPKCKQTYRLDHSITIKGEVTPSVVCPTKDCSFHDNVLLEEYY